MGRPKSPFTNFFDQFKGQAFHAWHENGCSLVEYTKLMDRLFDEVHKSTGIMVQVGYDQWQGRKRVWYEEWKIGHGGPSPALRGELLKLPIWCKWQDGVPNIPVHSINDVSLLHQVQEAQAKGHDLEDTSHDNPMPNPSSGVAEQGTDNFDYWNISQHPSLSGAAPQARGYPFIDHSIGRPTQAYPTPTLSSSPLNHRSSRDQRTGSATYRDDTANSAWNSFQTLGSSNTTASESLVHPNTNPGFPSSIHFNNTSHTLPSTAVNYPAPYSDRRMSPHSTSQDSIQDFSTPSTLPHLPHQPPQPPRPTFRVLPSNASSTLYQKDHESGR